MKPRTGNFCSAELQAEVTDVINLLKQLRSQPELCWRLRRCGSRWPVRVERPQRSHPRSRSQPESEANVESEAEIDDLKREAVSECQVDTDLPLASLEDLKDAKHCETVRSIRICVSHRVCVSISPFFRHFFSAMPAVKPMPRRTKAPDLLRCPM